MKTALLTLVHGSPRAEANADMQRVLELIRGQGAFHCVEAGFMECNEPDIPAAIDRCIQQGAERIVAVPYFLHTGTHVAEDLPTAIEHAQRRYPNIQFEMGRYIGVSPLITDVLSDRATELIA